MEYVRVQPVPLPPPFFPLSFSFSCSNLYIPGRGKKTRYLCNQSVRLLSLGAESFSRFELIAGWNVIKVRVEDATTWRKKKIPSGRFNSRIPPSMPPPFSTSFHVSFKDRVTTHAIMQRVRSYSLFLRKSLLQSFFFFYFFF